MDAITVADIDALLAYLPYFEEPETIFVETWVTDTGTFPYPRYTQQVRGFFRLAGQPCWSDYDYNPPEAGAMVADDACIADATLLGIKTMLTFCVRGERFTDGHWAHLLQEGRVQAILRRLAVLRQSL